MRFVLIGLAAILLGGCGKSSGTAPQGAESTPPTSKPNEAPKSIHTQEGTQISESVLGLKLYPGAKVVTSGAQGRVVSANLETSDDPAKVIAFYETELGVKAKSKGGLYSVQGSKGGTSYAVVSIKSKGMTSISILGEKK